MKASATNFGFDPTWIADILQKYGADVLALAIEAARNGFSISFIVEILQKFGPAVLQFLLSVFTHHQASLRAVGDVIPGNVIEGTDVTKIDASVLEIIIQQYLPLIIQKFFPSIWTQFGPIITQFLQNNLQTIMDNYGPLIVQFLQNNLPQIIQLIVSILNTNVSTKK